MCGGGLASCNLDYVSRDGFVSGQDFVQMMCGLSV